MCVKCFGKRGELPAKCVCKEGGEKFNLVRTHTYTTCVCGTHTKVVIRYWLLLSLSIALVLALPFTRKLRLTENMVVVVAVAVNVVAFPPCYGFSRYERIRKKALVSCSSSITLSAPFLLKGPDFFYSRGAKQVTKCHSFHDGKNPPEQDTAGRPLSVQAAETTTTTAAVTATMYQQQQQHSPSSSLRGDWGSRGEREKDPAAAASCVRVCISLCVQSINAKAKNDFGPLLSL